MCTILFIIGRGVVYDQYQADVFSQSFPTDVMRMSAPFAAQHQQMQLGMGMHAAFVAQHQQVQLGMRMHAPFAAQHQQAGAAQKEIVRNILFSGWLCMVMACWGGAPISACL